MELLLECGCRGGYRGGGRAGEGQKKVIITGSFPEKEIYRTFAIKCIHLEIHEVHSHNQDGGDSFNRYLSALHSIIQVPYHARHCSRHS